MAAVLCRAFCVTPCELCCKGCSKCFEACGGVCGHCCDCFSYCCENFFSNPLVCCFVITSGFSIGAFVMALLAVVNSNQCANSTLTIVWGIVMIVCLGINVWFSYYAYMKLTGQHESTQNDGLTQGRRAVNFFYEDTGFACYICFCIAEMVWAILGIAWASSCTSSVAPFLSIGSALLFSYLGLSMLILMLYMCGQCFKDMSKQPCNWIFCCLWPCLFLGYLAAQEEQSGQNAQQGQGQGQGQAQASAAQTTVPQSHQPPPPGNSTYTPAYNPYGAQPSQPGQVVLNVGGQPGASSTPSPGFATAEGQSSTPSWFGRAVVMATGARR